MGSFYLDAASGAENALREFGQVATLRRVIETGYDTETAQATTATLEQQIVAAGFDVDSKLVDGSSVLAGDQTFLVAAPGIQAPEVGDALLWPLAGGEAPEHYRVVGVKTLAPAGVPVLYEVQARR